MVRVQRYSTLKGLPRNVIKIPLNRTSCEQVGAVANMSALLMKQMLEDAEQQGATLAFDTSTVEDQGENSTLLRLWFEQHITLSWFRTIAPWLVGSMAGET